MSAACGAPTIEHTDPCKFPFLAGKGLGDLPLGQFDNRRNIACRQPHVLLGLG